MITCKQATDFISKKEERKLSATQRFQLWFHLSACVLCRLFFKQNNIIVSALKKDDEAQEKLLSAEEKQEMINAILTDKK